MGKEDTKYFYLGGLISLSLFLFFLFMFAVILFDVQKQKTYGLKKEKFVSVSIVTQPKKPKKVQKKKSSKLKPQKTLQTTQKQDVDVNDLFSDVWTQKVDTSHKPKKPRKVNSKRIQEIAKSVKKLKERKVESITEKLSDIDTPDTKTQDSSQTSSADEVNEYLAKIQAIVYDNFAPPPNSQGNVVQIVIELDPIGKMVDFRILRYSASEALNAEADRIKARLSNVIFPKNPENKSFRAIINLIPENKE